MRAICLAILALCPLVAWSAELRDVPEQARAEVVRRGDFVVHTLQRSAAAAEFGDVIGLPADDSHKWFISVITSKDSPYSDKLRSDLAADPYLTCWVNVKEPGSSWAHYHEYSAQDATQAHRWKAIQIAGYPTILVQPPLSGRYGDPQTVVLQVTGYDGKSKALSDLLAATIRRYVQAVPPKAASPAVPNRGMQAGPEDRGAGQLPIGADPPFTLPTTPATPSPNVVLPLPVAPAPASPTPAMPSQDLWSLLTALLGGVTTSPWIHGSLLLSILGLQLWRHLRKSTGQKVLLDDATFDALIESLRSIVNPTQATSSAEPASGPTSPASSVKP